MDDLFRGSSVQDWLQNGVFPDVRSIRWMNDGLSVQRNGAGWQNPGNADTYAATDTPVNQAVMKVNPPQNEGDQLL